MALVDWQIRQLCEKGMVIPFDPALLNPASLDVRLGNMLIGEGIIRKRRERPKGFWPTVAWWMLETFLPKYEETGDIEIDISDATKENPFLVEPGEFFLAQTLEKFYVPDHVSFCFALKSSRAREAYDHSFAGWGDPGFHDSVLTLEVKNNSRIRKIALYPGLRIGQVIFHGNELHAKSLWQQPAMINAKPYRSYRETGRYNGDSTVQGSKG